MGHASDRVKTKLFEPLSIRTIELRNRIVVSPMCQYSSTDGFADDWHLVHLGSRSVGGAGLIFTEASAVDERGRISPLDLGIWKDEHVEMLARITRFVRSQGAHIAIQLSHAGRKASIGPPWAGKRGWISEQDGGWIPLAPTTQPITDDYGIPHALTKNEIQQVVKAFADGARRSLEAGFSVVEIHAAHGYLIHEFLSPLCNTRTDEYGGPFENRVRLLIEITKAVRSVWPEHLPLFVRISVTDWAPDGWSVDESVELAKRLKPLGVDAIDCTSGGVIRWATQEAAEAPLYQVPFARRIRHEADMVTVAVGGITTAEQAESVIGEGSADLVALARRLLGDPYFPLRAAHELTGHSDLPLPYKRAIL